MNSIKILNLLMLLMISLAIQSTSLTAGTDLTPTLKVVPKDNIFYTNETSPGTTFEISIIAEDVEGLYGWELILMWSPGLINCTEEEINYNIWSYFNGPWVSDPIDNEKGEYHQSLTGRYPASAVSGTFWLVNLTFQIIEEPGAGRTLQTPLTLSPAPGYTYCLLDQSAEEIPHNFEHGVYKYISTEAVPQIKVGVIPENIINPAYEPSTIFNLNITASDVVNLHGFKFELSYNKTIVRCLEVQEGDFLKYFGTTTMAYIINNEDGYTFVSINLTEPMAFAEGEGLLATFIFNVTGIGESKFHIYNALFYDPEGNEIPAIIKDGYFNNILMPTVFIDPALIIDPSMTPSTEFQVEIKVANVSNLFGFEFNITYDTNVLNALGLMVIPFQNETSFDFWLSINDEIGNIWLKVQYNAPAEPLVSLDPIPLARVFFQVSSYGYTYIHFEQSHLSDYEGNSLMHIAKDGFISILRRDITVISIIPEFTEVYKGWVVQVNVTVKNLGDIAENFTVKLFCGDIEVAITEVTDLLPNSMLTVTFLLDTTEEWAEPCHNYTTRVEVSQVPYEINVTNNILEEGYIHILLMGDINCDGYVNASDAIIAGVAFGSSVGDPLYDPKADLNRDGYINAKDLVLLGANFGASCH